MSTALPAYARFAAIAGRPIVLLAALAMSAPGEYALAISAGWTPDIAWLMPVTLSAYAGVAAVIAATSGRMSARIGAGFALSLALAAQVTAHLIASGYAHSNAVLVAATSAVPPVVVAHMLHLAATPTERSEGRSASEPSNRPQVTVSAPLVAAERVSAPDPVAVADEYWQDFDRTAETAPDSEADTVATPPKPDEVRAVIAELKSAHGRDVTGQMLASHYSVSERTGRRYLAMSGDAT